MSESKPRQTRRKLTPDGIETRVGILSWDQLGGDPAYCPSGARRRRGMSFVRAFVWNVGTCRVMRRENPISVVREGGKYRCMRQGRTVP